jgi:hypothetical protein
MRLMYMNERQLSSRPHTQAVVPRSTHKRTFRPLAGGCAATFTPVTPERQRSGAGPTGVSTSEVFCGFSASNLPSTGNENLPCPGVNV